MHDVAGPPCCHSTPAASRVFPVFKEDMTRCLMSVFAVGVAGTVLNPLRARFGVTLFLSPSGGDTGPIKNEKKNMQQVLNSYFYFNNLFESHRYI